MDGRGSGAEAGWPEAVGRADTHPTDLASVNPGGFSDAPLSLAAGPHRGKRVANRQAGKASKKLGRGPGVGHLREEAQFPTLGRRMR
jgi:hypothetical protein